MTSNSFPRREKSDNIKLISQEKEVEYTDISQDEEVYGHWLRWQHDVQNLYQVNMIKMLYLADTGREIDR